jgi:hypothetical protein
MVSLPGAMGWWYGTDTTFEGIVVLSHSNGGMVWYSTLNAHHTPFYNIHSQSARQQRDSIR